MFQSEITLSNHKVKSIHLRRLGGFMKKTVMLLGLLVGLSGCSSLITQRELRDCSKKCSEKGIQKLCKDEGKVKCECK